MQITVEVIGYKAFKGSIDGKVMNTGVFFSIVRLDERFNKTEGNDLNWKGGHCVEEWKVGDTDLIMRVVPLKPSIKNPVAMVLEIERVSNGKETTELVIDARPLERQAAGSEPAAAAAPAQLKKAA